MASMCRKQSRRPRLVVCARLPCSQAQLCATVLWGVLGKAFLPTQGVFLLAAGPGCPVEWPAQGCPEVLRLSKCQHHSRGSLDATEPT